MASRHRGFTIIELLIVIAIIGIIAAIAIPNLLNAMQRSRQKRTMADMRTIATAVGAYQADAAFYPRGVSDMAQLSGHVEPLYLKAVPSSDGWSGEFNAASTAVGNHYTLVSYGRNGQPDGFAGYGTLTNEFKADIFITDGEFVQFPEGVQVGE